MTSIFISYRNADTAPYAGRLNDVLANKFGQKSIFYDKYRLEDGDVWPEELEHSIRDSQIVLVLISNPDTWLGVERFGIRRIDKAEDWVRKEVETALNENKIVIPVLINGGEVPPIGVLPDSLHRITTLQARKINDDTWGDSLPRLLQIIEEKLGTNTRINQNNVNQKFNWASFFKIHALKIPYKGPIITVNCDRYETYGGGLIKHFNEYYNKEGNMVFFVPACTSQRPVSLAKRLSFDLTTLKKNLSLYCPRVSIDKESEIRVIDFEPSQSDFDSTFSKTWEQCISSFSSDAHDPVLFATSGEHRKYDVILFVFRVSEMQWRAVNNLCEHIEFFIRKFDNQGAYTTKFILFFSFEIRTLHLGSELSNNNLKMDQLLSLANRTKVIPGIYSYISPVLRPVEEDEIKDWFSHIAPYVKLNTLAELIDTFRSNTSNDGGQSNLFNMEDVEELQQAAYLYSLNQSV